MSRKTLWLAMVLTCLTIYQKPIDVKETFLYSAGYLICKDLQVEGTFDYFNEFGNYTEQMSRGG